MGDKTHTLCEQAMDAIEAGDTDRAAALHAEAMKIDPEHPEVLLVAGEIAFAMGDVELALGHFLAASEAAPDWPVPVLAAARAELEGLGLDEAIARLVGLASHDDPAVRTEALLELATAELLRDKPKAVRKHLRELVAIEDQPIEFSVDAGDIAREIEDVPLAERFYRRALAIDPDHANALYGLGFVLRETGKKDEMIKCWQRVRALDLAEPRPAFKLSHEEIDRIAHEALRELPDPIAKMLADVPVLVDDAPSDAQIADGMEPRLLGLFEGTPLPEKSHTGGSPTSPDAAYVFVRNIEALCVSEDDLREEIRITILHETAHYFGLEDEDLDELGLG